MRTIAKQITINVMLIIISFMVIIFAKAVNSNSFFTDYKEYICSDFVFVMITSLFTTIGWRFAEGIGGCWFYNIVIFVLLFGLTLEYGMVMVISNDVLTTLIIISFCVFLLFYIVENVIIVFYFLNKVKSRDKDKEIDKLSYRKEELGEQL